MIKSLTTHCSPLLLALVLLFATPALAADSPNDQFDANGDGQITFPEVMQKLEKSARSAFDGSSPKCAVNSLSVSSGAVI